MPNVRSVNLSALSKSPSHSAHALYNLSILASGPLRLQKKVENGNTVIYLGVRSWSTYFFEKIIATPAQVAKAKLKTQVAIDQHVRSFMNNSGLTFSYNEETIVANLQSKTVGKSVSPVVISEAEENGKSDTRPNYKKREVVEAKGELLSGTGTVPTGLSIAKVEPLRIIADVRLVTEGTFGLKTVANQLKGQIYSLGEFPDVDKTTSVADFKKYYLGKLDAVAAFVHTSAVMELAPDDEKNCSEAHLTGAYAAAKEFREKQIGQGKHVSIMLAVLEMPSIQKKEASTVSTIDKKPTANPKEILVQTPNDEDSEE
ncbi:MAG: hypothetical protein JWM30_2075 [Burkholderia sp.]|nr:hypothetical protein [Burkholderia sp.]